MPLAALVADTLRAWREAERLLDLLPSGSPEHETAQLLVLELRTQYAQLTAAQSETVNRIQTSSVTIERARSVLTRLGDGSRLHGGGLPEAR